MNKRKNIAITFDNFEQSNLGEYAKQQIREAKAGKGNGAGSTREKKAGHRTADPAAHMEQHFVNGTKAVYAGEKFNTPVRVDIYSTRARKTDVDNVSVKALLDGCVKSGVLEDDSPDFIRQYQVHNPEIGEEEKTVVVIEEI